MEFICNNYGFIALIVICWVFIGFAISESTKDNW